MNRRWILTISLATTTTLTVAAPLAAAYTLGHFTQQPGGGHLITATWILIALAILSAAWTAAVAIYLLGQIAAALTAPERRQ
jgi:hypothetical protein